MQKVRNTWLRKGSLAEQLGYPSQHQLLMPLLLVIHSRGGATRPRDVVDGCDLYEALGRKVGLSKPAMLACRPGTKTLAWKNHVGWARYTLAKHGFLVSDPPGTWRLTSKGTESVASGSIQVSYTK